MRPAALATSLVHPRALAGTSKQTSAGALPEAAQPRGSELRQCTCVGLHLTGPPGTKTSYWAPRMPAKRLVGTASLRLRGPRGARARLQVARATGAPLAPWPAPRGLIGNC